jgi:hypothetical protein
VHFRKESEETQYQANLMLHKKEKNMATLAQTVSEPPRIDQEEEISVLTREEFEAQIAHYEKVFGMSSAEFLRKMEEGTADDTFETMHWMMLLRHC